jgi:hypothetical protein
MGQTQPLRKSEEVVAHRYFGRFNKFRNDRWVLGTALTQKNTPASPT